MARLTDDGKIKAPPEGMPGFHIAWQDFNAWLRGEIPDQYKRLHIVRKHDPGGGGGDHSAAWDDGYNLARHNALVKLRNALGVNTGAVVKPRPDSGTEKRQGYDAGASQIQLLMATL